MNTCILVYLIYYKKFLFDTIPVNIPRNSC